MTVVACTVHPMVVAAPGSLVLAFAVTGFFQSRRYVVAVERIALQSRSTRSSPRSGARKPRGRGR